MTGVAIIKDFCEHCRKIIFAIEKRNLEVPVGKRIQSIDASNWENFKMRTEPLIDKIKFDGYPHILLGGGINVSNILTRKQFESFLDGYLDKDKII